MKFYRAAFYFLLLIPIFVLTSEVRKTLVDTRAAQADLFLLNGQMNSHQRTIIGLECRILHFVEDHQERYLGCPHCFGNLIREEFDHDMIRKFLRENGIGPPGRQISEDDIL